MKNDNQVKCEYCGGWIHESDEYCSHCGAANKNLGRTSDGTARTIEELKEWYQAMNLPPEDVTRFFIGKDIREPKAFGIYRDGDKVVVYKNKADGKRAIRYEGTDEAYGVRELHLRLKEEIINQKANNGNKRIFINPCDDPETQFVNKFTRKFGIFLIIIFAAIIAILGYTISVKHSKWEQRQEVQGYYEYDDTLYYHLVDTSLSGKNSGWYEYDGSDWTITDDIPDELNNSDKYSPYSISNADQWGKTAGFEDTKWYSNSDQKYDGSNNIFGSSSSDSDYNWDSGSSWDSGGSDWDSDW